MFDEDFKINDRVEDPDYGKGTIVAINRETRYARVDLDSSKGGNALRWLALSQLKVIKETEAHPTNNDPNGTFKKGDRVYHDEYGRGVVTSTSGFFKCDVLFDNGKKIDKILNSKLILDIAVIRENELAEENVDTSFKIIPGNYSEQDYFPTGIKNLLTNIKKRFRGEGIASIQSFANDGGYNGVIVSPENGVIVFKAIDTAYDSELLNDITFPLIMNNYLHKFRDVFLRKLMLSKKLYKTEGITKKVLKFSYKFILILQSIKKDELSPTAINCLSKLEDNVYLRNFESLKNQSLLDNFENNEAKEIIPHDLYNSIIERIIPEYVTLVNVAAKPIIAKPEHTVKFNEISGNEREFGALHLEDGQIKIINSTKPGTHLFLANPGTGKSVLLVSKAYRLASKDKKAKVLITCYNKNLADHHTEFAQISGLMSSETENFRICTFHKLIKDLIFSVDPLFITHHPISSMTSEYDAYVDKIHELLLCCKIKFRFDAIFIDEIQLFDPKWIDICYSLLKEPVNNSYFEMYGDINQDVKAKRSKGTASWQKAIKLPSLKGKVRTLDVNYRNTEIIAKYINALISDLNNFVQKYDVPIDKEASCLTSKTSRKGDLKIKIIKSGQDTTIYTTSVIENIHKIYKADYKDIAVIYPARSYGSKYRPIDNLSRFLDSKSIPYSMISGDSIEKKSIFDCDGVILSTIDSSLGLDFKYVVLYGLHFWDFIHLEDNLFSFAELNEDYLKENPEIAFDVNEIGKKLYAACSRARDGLFIIDDCNEDSLVKQIIRPKSGGDYYEEEK